MSKYSFVVFGAGRHGNHCYCRYVTLRLEKDTRDVTHAMALSHGALRPRKKPCARGKVEHLTVKLFWSIVFYGLSCFTAVYRGHKRKF